MKNSMRLSLIFLMILVSISCFSQRKVTVPPLNISPMADTTRIRKSTLIYALPRSVLTVKVEMERTIEIPGPYSKFAGDFLGLDNVIQNQDENWTITGISVISHEESDPSGFYVIETGRIFFTNALTLKSEGLILDIASDKGPASVPANTNKEADVSRFRSYDLGSDEYYHVQSDTAFRRVKVDSSFIRIPYIVEKKKRLTTEQLAEKAAKRLMELRDGKIMVLTGEANVFPQDQAAVSEINRLEKEYTELFTGKTFTEERSFITYIIPSKEMSGKPVQLFKFSEKTGPGDNSAKSGTPVFLTMTPEQKTKEITVISEKQPAASPVSNISDRLYYRIPDVADVKVVIGNELLYESRKLIYQFGEIMQMPSNYLLGK